MTSIYQEILGPAFGRLHPEIQKRFGFSSADGTCALGTGVMDELWHGRLYTLPFLYIGAWRRIMFPECGVNIPFSIANYAYRDGFDRETVTWIRTFRARRTRRFDAYMIRSQQRNRIVDYLGTHQHLAVDIDRSVDARGGLQLRSGEQRFYEGLVGFRFPMFFSGTAEVCEWYDESIRKFRIEVCVSNRFWGPLFGYGGTFSVEWSPSVPTIFPPTSNPGARSRGSDKVEHYYNMVNLELNIHSDILCDITRRKKSVRQPG